MKFSKEEEKWIGENRPSLDEGNYMEWSASLFNSDLSLGSKNRLYLLILWLSGNLDKCWISLIEGNPYKISINGMKDPRFPSFAKKLTELYLSGSTTKDPEVLVPEVELRVKTYFSQILELPEELTKEFLEKCKLGVAN